MSSKYISLSLVIGSTIVITQSAVTGIVSSLVKCLATSVDGIKLAPSGMGVYVVDDKNSIVGAMVATNPASAQSMFDVVNIPINLNFQAQAITSS